MKLTGMGMTRRCAGAVAVALVFFIGALPVAAACCFGPPTSPATASMQAAMPCCAGTCTLKAPQTARDHDVTLSGTSSPIVPLQLVADVRTVPQAPTRAGFGRSNELIAHEFSPPPPFLLNSQFRI